MYWGAMLVAGAVLLGMGQLTAALIPLCAAGVCLHVERVLTVKVQVKVYVPKE